MIKRLLTSATAFFCFCTCLQAQTKIQLEDAAKHIGETVTVTATVYNTTFYFRKEHRPIHIQLGTQAHKELLTLVINDAEKAVYFKTPSEWHTKTITVTGNVVNKEGKPQIVITSPDQIVVNKQG